MVEFQFTVKQILFFWLLNGECGGMRRNAYSNKYYYILIPFALKQTDKRLLIYIN